eukprot:3404148-Pleurochrysis_carterae.AAC.1
MSSSAGLSLTPASSTSPKSSPPPRSTPRWITSFLREARTSTRSTLNESMRARSQTCAQHFPTSYPLHALSRCLALRLPLANTTDASLIANASNSANSNNANSNSVDNPLATPNRGEVPTPALPPRSATSLRSRFG